MPAGRGKVNRAERELARLREHISEHDEMLAAVAGKDAAVLPPPPPQLVAAAASYNPHGKAVHLVNTSGIEHVVVVDGRGDPQDWWAYVNSTPQHGRPQRMAS
jgi:hypothetical protein